MVAEVVLSTSCKEIIIDNFNIALFREIFLVPEDDLTQEDYQRVVSSFEQAQQFHLLTSLIAFVHKNEHFRRIFATFSTLPIQRLIEAIIIKELNRHDPFLTLESHQCLSYYFRYCTEWGAKPVNSGSLAQYVFKIEERFRGSMLNVDVESYLAYLASGIPMESRFASQQHSIVSYFPSLIKLADKMDETPGGREKYFRYQVMIKEYIMQEGIMPILRHNFTILTHLDLDMRDLWKYLLYSTIDHETIRKLYKNESYKPSDVKNFKNWLLDLMRSHPELCMELKKLEIRSHDTQMRRFLEVGIKSGKVRATSSLVDYCELVHNTKFSHRQLFEIIRSEDVVQSPVFYQYLLTHLRGLNDEELQTFLVDFYNNARKGVTPPDIIANPAVLLCYLLVAKCPVVNHGNEHYQRFIQTVKEQLIHVEPNAYQQSQFVLLMRALLNNERKMLKNNMLQMVEGYRDELMSTLEGLAQDKFQKSAFVIFMRMGRKTQADKESASYEKMMKLIESYRTPKPDAKNVKSRRHSAGDRSRLFSESHSSSSESSSVDVSPVNSIYIKA